MAELSPAGGILSPETLLRRRLLRAPPWLQRLGSNVLAVLAWVGLPSTVISTVKDLRWVLEALAWLYDHAGAAQPVLAVMGQGLSAIVAVWRWLTHPIWHAVAEWLHLTLPAWAPDVLTLLALFGVGLVRRVLRVAWGDTISGAMMFKAATKFGRPEDRIAIPRKFPYEQHFADCGVRWTPRRLQDAQRMWRRWRKEQIGPMLIHEGARWPTFHKDVICAEFERYWLSITEGRRDMLLYAGAAAIVLFAVAADWLLQLP